MTQEDTPPSSSQHRHTTDTFDAAALQPTPDRRTILASLAGGAAVSTVGPASATAAASPESVSEKPAIGTGRLAQKQGADGTPETLEGQVTTAPVSVDDWLLVGTSRGLYAFEDDELESFVPTRPVRTIEPLSGDRAAVLVRDEFFDNILGVDVASGTREWSAAETQDVYNNEIGKVERQVPVFDAVAFGGSGGTANVAVAAGYGIHGFDGETGERLWSVDRERYTWRITEQDGTVYTSTQDGSVVAVDPSSGDVEFETSLVDTFSARAGEVSRSVWDVEAIGGSELAVTTEDGFVTILDGGDGSVLKESRVLELDDDALETYFNRRDGLPSMPARGDDPANFFNLELTVVDGDARSFVVTVTEYVPQGQDEQRLEYVGAEGEWTNASIDLSQVGNVLYNEAVDPDHLIVPKAPKEGTQDLVRIDVQSGSETDGIEIPAVPISRLERGGGGGTVSYLGTSGSNIALATTDGELRVANTDGEIQWSFPAIRRSSTLAGDFTGDGTEDTLVIGEAAIDPRQRGVESNVLALRSGSDGSPAWSKFRGVQEFTTKGGWRYLSTVGRPGGGRDLVALEQPPRQEEDEETQQVRDEIRNKERDLNQLQDQLDRARNGPGDNEDEISNLESQIQQVENDLQSLQAELNELVGDLTPRIVVLSGDDGSEMDESFDIVSGGGSGGREIRVVSVAVISESSPRTVFIGTRDSVLATDLDADQFFFTAGYGGSSTWPPLGENDARYTAVGGADSGVSDLLAYSQRNATFAVMELDRSGDSLSVQGTTDIGYDAEGLTGEVTVLGDLTGDGYQEVLANARTENGTAVAVISPGQGEVAIEKTGDFGTLPDPVPTVSREGNETGLLLTSPSENSFTVEYYEELEQVWQFEQSMRGRGRQLFRRTDVRPAAPAGDLDGDGQEEIAVATVGETGAKVDFFNASSNERVDRLILERFGETVDLDEDDFAPGVLVERIPDRTGNGQPELGVVVDSIESLGEPSFYVVSPSEGTVLASGDWGPSQFVPLEDGVGLLGDDGGLDVVDLSGGVTLDEPSGDAEMDLSWQFADDREYVTTVTVNNQPVTVTSEQSTTVRLPPGDHDIEVAARTPDGISYHDSTTVSVSGGSSMDLLLYAATAVSVLGLFAFSLVEAIRRRVNQ